MSLIGKRARRDAQPARRGLDELPKLLSSGARCRMLEQLGRRKLHILRSSQLDHCPGLLSCREPSASASRSGPSRPR
jgi:hypothetical protein